MAVPYTVPTGASISTVGTSTGTLLQMQLVIIQVGLVFVNTGNARFTAKMLSFRL
jgi:hypothetical protein